MSTRDSTDDRTEAGCSRKAVFSFEKRGVSKLVFKETKIKKLAS